MWKFSVRPELPTPNTMPLGKYYCDYCDKQFQDTPAARKRHLQGVQHQRARALWYDSIRHQGQPATLPSSPSRSSLPLLSGWRVSSNTVSATAPGSAQFFPVDSSLSFVGRPAWRRFLPPPARRHPRQGHLSPLRPHGESSHVASVTYYSRCLTCTKSRPV